MAITYPLAVICKYSKDFLWYVKYYRKNINDCVWVSDHKSAFGKHFRGFTLVGSVENCVDDLPFIIDYIEAHTKMSVQDCLNQLNEKQKVLHWLIAGHGQTGLPFSSMQYLTIDRICELYNVNPSYFVNL